MKACECNATLGNTGQGCTPIMDATKKLILVRYKDDDGVRNGIDLTDTLNAAYLTAAINNTDGSQRWFPTPEIKNVEDTRAESSMETFEDGSMVQIQQGARTFTGIIVQGKQQLLKALETYNCQDVAAFSIDKQGNLIGSIGDQDECEISYLYPIRIEKGSIDPVLVKTTDTTAQKLQVRFQWHIDERDGNLRMITADEFDADLLAVEGLLDVCSVVSNITTTSFRADLRTFYGTPLNPVRVQGLVNADFALYNVTDSASVTISGVSEVSAGVYDFTFTAQTNGDVLRLTPTKNGYDFSAVVANTIQVPLT